MQNSLDINWILEITKIAVPSITTILVALGLGYWLSGRTEKLKAELQIKLYEYQLQRDEQKLMLGKLEELYEQVTELMKTSFWFTSKAIEYSKEDFHIEKLNEITSLILSPINRITTLIAFYTSSINNEFNMLSDSVIALQTYGSDFVEHITKDEEELYRRKNEVIAICSQILVKVRKESRQYRRLIKK